MSLILAINTASKESALALVEKNLSSGDSGGVLAEQSWASNANESQKLLPGVLEMFKETGRGWEDLDEVFVVEGPGAYTSLRVGVVIANAIAWQLKIPLRSTDAFTVWQARIKESAGDSHLVALAAGRDNFLTSLTEQPKTLEELEKLGPKIYGEIPKGEPEFSFGEGVAKLDFKTLKKQTSVKPLYVRPPDITIPKKRA